MKDRLFEKPLEKQFEFDEEVAAVFDDMIERSVPFYRQNLDLIVTLLLRFLKPGMRVVDLGSSTGLLLIELARRCGVEVEFIGIDNAPAMVELARKKSRALEADVTFLCEDLMRYDFGGADVVVANYTLQFIRPAVRGKTVQKIYDALKEGGLFVCSEKVLMEDKWLNKQIIDIYYDYKKGQGYSETEIMRKREALENVLIPYTIEENRSMMKEAGFSAVDTLFQWGNFATMVARKRGK
ncbi:carboxy-S-adenosyl-L-methionine synthase CmoA [Hydrogenimonas urashimensis]|uniref:carboxy-S-adenosyl-L-methionine synthase CmoA n=1 Tax=Hydrogenimonas urashimensis TaxID=2740515 RepID=UPI0019166F97|nr:carboxy-S-adenosyl-L-methionine synthase CmoA [Hydrogenimonas urashimensis]